MKRIFKLSFILLIVVAITGWHNKSKLNAYWTYATVSSSDREFSAMEITGNNALVMDEKTGEVLFYKNDRETVYPASTTKILTAIIAIEQGDLYDTVNVGEEVKVATADESRAGLYEGQKLPLRDLLYAMMLPSGNDAARSVAVYIAKKHSGNAHLTTEEGIGYFAGLMNKKAKSVGAENSHFMNPHGLHEDEHYTTAHDMALIARYAMNNAEFRKIVSTGVFGETEDQPAMKFTNRNRLIQKGDPYYYSGAIGVKTGFTDQAGYCLVSSAVRDGRELLSVVLHSTEDGVWEDSKKLLEYGFAK